ncbi:MAG: hypothetical protein DLM72_11520 [Candidatus Nitrosopolaris wilkensis]|nr:MAG: hypothetical protein DLM72_11520 [Candidatus Nitrosopolaris wilkensis]
MTKAPRPAEEILCAHGLGIEDAFFDLPLYVELSPPNHSSHVRSIRFEFSMPKSCSFDTQSAFEKVETCGLGSVTSGLPIELPGPGEFFVGCTLFVCA